VKKLNEVLSKNINYAFKDDDVLLEALTHPSLRNWKLNGVRTRTNQRLEFLGDSILNMVVSVLLFKLFPDEDEGALTKRKKALICGNTIADVAKKIKLGEFLFMTNYELTSGGAQNEHFLENGLEALIGAIFIDGGFKNARRFIERFWCQLMESMVNLNPPDDFRSSLQEWAQENGLPLPRYHVTKKIGLNHNPEFTVLLSVKNHPPIKACASTIKAAKREAAKMMLDKIQIPKF